ncbi:MAG: Tim44-like domain-containing protein [Elusimicrobiota bacterium]|nr:MAG: Tim44-like domain-containing protein [Elusimicrobiota bacterium]
MRRILLLSVLLAAGLAVRAAARAGDGQNYSGGGGSYSPGGYSSYSSSPYSGPYRRYRPGLLDAYVLWVVTNPLQGIPVTLFLLYVVVSCLKFKHAAPPSADIVTRQPYIESEAELERLRVRDPSFDVRTFLARCDAAFLKVQEAWSAGDMAPARAFLSDGVAERFGRQLASLKKRGLRNVLTEVEIESSRLVHAFSGTHFDALSVAFTVRARDETLDGSGRRIKGSSGRLPFQEVWTFLRRPGARTLGRAGTLEGRARAAARPCRSSTRRAARPARPGSIPPTTTGSSPRSRRPASGRRRTTRHASPAGRRRRPRTRT